MNTDPVLEIEVLGLHWKTTDPFLFCAYHNDAYPKGNVQMGPAASLSGRNIGMDFELRDGWRMYHGDVVPGFPQHPHRGFETITLVRRGLVDHSDSLGATARYGGGDCQFSMFWQDTIPKKAFKDEAGREVEITVIAGEAFGLKPPHPPPASWAAHPESDVALWIIKLAPGAVWTVPKTLATSQRKLFFYRGDGMAIGQRSVPGKHGVLVRADVDIQLEAGSTECELLLMQGKPIGEKVVQHGPFVMNSAQEIQQAFIDYRRTGFGGWPWKREDPVHAATEGRFAKHADGRLEKAKPV
jgi:redox-sensitive bicupin YhaK (pirin superfamily)